MRLKVSHGTRFSYTGSVSHAVSRLCLQPRNTPQQQVISHRLSMYPEAATSVHSLDRYGNPIVQIDLAVPHEQAEIKAVSLVETQPEPTLPQDISIEALGAHGQQSTGEDMLMAEDFLLRSLYVPSGIDTATLIAELQLAPRDSQGVLALAQALTHHIFTHFEYDPGYSSVATPLNDVMQARRGVCQDFAHAAIAVCRDLGIPARYVSGYLETVPPPGVEKLQGADASHAWFSVYTGTTGWYDFDPTNNKRPDEQYVTTAWGRDYRDVAPIQGVMYGGGQQKLDVAVDVDRAPTSGDTNRVRDLFPS